MEYSAAQRALNRNAVLASSRIYRIIADPALDGAEPWLVEMTLSPDYDRAFIAAIIEMLIAEGSVMKKDGLLYPVPYEPS